LSSAGVIEPLYLSVIELDERDFGEGDQVLEGVYTNFYFSEKSLSTHFLFLGSTGTGKTNAIFQFVDIIKNKMLNKDDVMIIFDTKGDYYSRFFDKNRGDIAISNRSSDEVWNIFEEIKQDDISRWEQDAYEISLEIFDESLRNSKDQYFPMAALDVTRAVIITLLRNSVKNGFQVTNEDLYKALALNSAIGLRNLITTYPDLLGAAVHIYNPDSAQTQGVLGEIKQVIERIFSGKFGQPGSFSVRKFIKEKGGKTLFLEYDLTYGKLLTPLYRLIIDLAIKESLGRELGGKGNIYFIIDEFGLLPNLYHIEDAINFGREMGVKFLVGTQNVEQIIGSYGTERAKSILSNFGTVFSFRQNDKSSKEIVSDRYGEYNALVTKKPIIPNEPFFRTIVKSQVIEPLVLSLLNTGQSIVCISGKEPRYFTFKKVI